MELSGRPTIVFATLLVSSLATWSCWAQSPTLPPATPALALRSASDDQPVQLKPTPLESIDAAPADRLRDHISGARRLNRAKGNGAPNSSSAKPGSSGGATANVARATGAPLYRPAAAPVRTTKPIDGPRVSSEYGSGATARRHYPCTSKHRRLSRLTLASRSTSPPPCGSPTPGR